MKIAIVTLGIGHHYPAGVARMIREFDRVSPGYQVQAWVNTLPPGAPERVIEGGWDYTAYCAKPFAMKAAMDSGAEIVLWLDASVYPVRPIQPLIEYISAHGYYMAPSGFTVGQWSSDACLEHFRIDCGSEPVGTEPGGGAMMMKECASGIVGLDLRQDEPEMLLTYWSKHWHLFPGHHSNTNAKDKKHAYRNSGHVSDDPRCQGHRQDQTVLSILAHQLGMTEWVPWPRYVAYQAGYGGQANESTCLMIGGPA